MQLKLRNNPKIQTTYTKCSFKDSRVLSRFSNIFKIQDSGCSLNSFNSSIISVLRCMHVSIHLNSLFERMLPTAEHWMETLLAVGTIEMLIFLPHSRHTKIQWHTRMVHVTMGPATLDSPFSVWIKLLRTDLRVQVCDTQ